MPYGLPGDPSHTGMKFGYHRVGIFAVLLNALSLGAIALFIAWEANRADSASRACERQLMIGVAAVAIVLIDVWLHGRRVCRCRFGRRAPMDFFPIMGESRSDPHASGPPLTATFFAA